MSIVRPARHSFLRPRRHFQQSVLDIKLPKDMKHSRMVATEPTADCSARKLGVTEDQQDSLMTRRDDMAKTARPEDIALHYAVLHRHKSENASPRRIGLKVNSPVHRQEQFFREPAHIHGRTSA
ncbi:hypothetical protein JP75_07925 [Devosia riboflavina]|uniref:Uncharacterized protein n=1 Tax=Devosia riboflavina TaxID=46914 RepID=A0A087M3L4_9HYPH|nr:hypothetical protein JP75_07925 [Devosia riboflavina]